ncbi:MAG: ATP-binding protein [Sulfurimonas sp.]|nr:ATP-binding protein [Sulfurimonas sp.]
MKLNLNTKRDIKISSFMYIPTKMSMLTPNFNTLFEQIFINNTKKEIDKVFISKIRGIDDYHKFLIIEYIKLDFINKKLDLFKLNDLNNLHIDNVNIFINKSLLIEELTKVKDFNITEKIFNQYTRNISFMKINKLSQEQKLFYLEYLEYFQFELTDEKGRTYSSLSYGEKKIFGLLINIYNILRKDKNNKLFLLDEPDLGLHPRWQKNYLNELIELMKQFHNHGFIRKYHFIITSHSPFMISDLPKDNVIFLKDGKQVDVDINPFGANIHTLLSHGFFMEGGLMGEFAKGKIDEVIKLLNSPNKLTDKEIQHCENIISIIGEPIIKNQLRRMLDSKNINYIAKDVKDEIEFLKHRIEMLRKNK